MSAPVILDLFAGAGGAGAGYERAGFRVVAVDIEPHPDNPHELHVGGAISAMEELLLGRGVFRGIQVDAIHLSPPCQAYSSMTADYKKHLPLVPSVRELAIASGLPYVIENVMGAPLREATKLCGSMFDLGVRRHRLFETNFRVDQPPCRHKQGRRPVGVYGKGPDNRVYLRTDGTERGRKARSVEEAQEAMGIDWMEWDDLKEAIPPAYTEYVGGFLLRHLQEHKETA